MKKCPYCAEEIQGEAIICRFCGRDLPKGPDTIQPTQPPKKAIKSPGFAVLLNAIPLFGIGYIYLGLWSRFAIVILIQLFSLMPMTFIGLREYNKYLLLIVWIISIFDVYNQAKLYNQKKA